VVLDPVSDPGQGGRVPVTLDRLEHASNLASVVRSLKLSPNNFGRFGRELHYLLNGLREESGQERLHHFARALEALILPETGSTRNQFVHRCQLFALANPAAVSALKQSYDMRSDAEHIQDWDRSLQNASPEKAEDVAPLAKFRANVCVKCIIARRCVLPANETDVSSAAALWMACIFFRPHFRA
jgi:hypothetical protein